MRNPLLLCAGALLLAACQPTAQEAPADAPAAPETPAPVDATPAFVGRWAAEANWCANTMGPERPIELTETEFRGYENTCQISDLAEADGGWTATLACQAEGETRSQPVRIEADTERLMIAWQGDGYDVEWRRCPG